MARNGGRCGGRLRVFSTTVHEEGMRNKPAKLFAGDVVEKPNRSRPVN